MLSFPSSASSRQTAYQGFVALLGLAAILLVVWVVFFRNDVQRPEAPSAQYYQQTYGGSLNDLSRILGNPDCDALQRTMEQANLDYEALPQGTPESRVQIGLMAAAADRMNELGCP